MNFPGETWEGHEDSVDMEKQKATDFVSKVWDSSILPALCDYIKVENQSPAYDPTWRENGLLDKAVHIAVEWAKKQPGFEKVEVLKLKDEHGRDRTPLVFIDVPSNDPSCKDTVLLYGHLDKQPPLRPWAEGLDPYKPVIKDGKVRIFSIL